MLPQNVTFSRHNSLIPSVVARIDKEQLNTCQTLSRHAMSGVIDKEQLAVTGARHGQGLPVSMQAIEQRRYSDQAVTVSGVGSGPGVLHRSVSAPDTGRRGSSLGMIACLDEEQVRGLPSSSEIWRKKKMSMREDTASFLCPCLSQLLEQQVEENRRIQSSNQNTLTLVGIMYLLSSIDQYSLSGWQDR